MTTVKTIYRPLLNRRQRAIINLSRRRKGLKPICRDKDGVVRNSSESYTSTYIKATIAELLNFITLKPLRVKRKKHLWVREMEKQKSKDLT